MNCTVLGGTDGYYIHDFCWFEKDTIVSVQGPGMEVLIVNIDMQAQTCNFSVRDSGYFALRVACAPDGKFYVTDFTQHTVWVYDRNGSKEEWKPAEEPEVAQVEVGSNRIFLSPWRGNSTSEYDMERNFISTVNMAGGLFEIASMSVSEDGRFLLGTGIKNGHHLFIHDLRTNTTKIVGREGTGDGELGLPSNSYMIEKLIMVSERDNNRISLFSPDGEFLQHLEFVGGGDPKRGMVSVLPRPGKPRLLGLGKADILRIYSLIP